MYTAASHFAPTQTVLHNNFYKSCSYICDFGRPWSALVQVLVRYAWTDSTIISAAFSRDGTRVVTGSFHQTVEVWDTILGSKLQELHGHEGWVHSVDMSPDGTHIVSGSQDTTIRIWDATSSTEAVTILRGHESAVLSVAFSADGTRIVSGSRDAAIRLWKVTSGLELIPPLRGHVSGVWSVAFSTDGCRVVSGSCDGTIRVWEVTSGAEMVPPLRGHENPVMSVAFSPDGTHIISGSYKNNRIWDTQSGCQLFSSNHSFPSFSTAVKDGWIVDMNNQRRLCKIPSMIKNKRWLMEKLMVKYWFSGFSPHRLCCYLGQDEEGSGEKPNMEHS